MTKASVTLQAQLTNSTTAYAAGDVIGGVLALNPQAVIPSGTIRRVKLLDDENLKPAATVHLFHTRPTATYTDNGAYAPTLADLKAYANGIVVVSADWSTVNGNGLAVKDDLAISVSLTDGNLYAVIESDGTPDYSVTNALFLEIELWVDRYSAG
ncbi:hypothetical protein HC928_18095 [bacterium]|nr:hypothetical protein [bacterium]